MAKRMNNNRYLNMHFVCAKMEVGRGVTATDLSKVMNLSRQSILKILGDAKLYGYVTCEEQPYRQHTRKVWTLTEHGQKQSDWTMGAIKAYTSRTTMKQLL